MKRFLKFGWMAAALLLVAVVAAVIYLRPSSSPETTDDEYPPFCTDPHCELVILPYNDFQQSRASQLGNELKDKIQNELGIVVTGVQVLPNERLTPDLMNDAKTRYSANKIVAKQAPKAVHDKVVIGLTTEDISTMIHGKTDYGIQGLAFVGGNSCVVSTFRVGKNVPLWKPALHEFIHAFWNMSHCKMDNPNCIMQDGHGRPNWGRKNSLCDSCKAYFK